MRSGLKHQDGPQRPLPILAQYQVNYSNKDIEEETIKTHALNILPELGCPQM